MAERATTTTRTTLRARLAAGIVAGAIVVGAAAPAHAQLSLVPQTTEIVYLDVMPPARPAGIGGPGTAPAQPAAPVAAARAEPAPAPTPVAQTSPADLTDAEVVARANDYFNGVTTMYAAFAQISPSGDRMTGQLYVHRPGRLRFDYDAPATIQVVADGRSVAVKDSALSTQDVYPISQTPLKFLLGSRVELGRGVAVLGVARFNDEIDVELEDRSTLGGTSRITLTFDQSITELKRWSILDPQGFTTTVALSDVDRVSRMDPTLFVILNESQGAFGSN